MSNFFRISDGRNFFDHQIQGLLPYLHIFQLEYHLNSLKSGNHQIFLFVGKTLKNFRLRKFELDLLRQKIEIPNAETLHIGENDWNIEWIFSVEFYEVGHDFRLEEVFTEKFQALRQENLIGSFLHVLLFGEHLLGDPPLKNGDEGLVGLGFGGGGVRSHKGGQQSGAKAEIVPASLLLFFDEHLYVYNGVSK